MVGFAAPLAAVVLGRGHDLRIGGPKVAVAQTGFVAGGNALPQHPTRRFTPTANGISDDLPGASAQRQPQPTLVSASEHP